MSKFKILITCPPMLRTVEESDLILADSGFEFTFAEVIQVLTEEELVKLLPKYDGWIIGDDPASRRVLEAGVAGNLKACVKWGVGTDNVDKDAMADLNIPWTNTPNMFGAEVAEMAVAYVLSLARNLFEIDRATRNGDWIKPSGMSLSGKRAAVVGFGDIGKNTASRLRALNMDVTVYDPGVSASDVREAGHNHEVWPTNVSSHDFLVLTCALTPSNTHMVNEPVLALCNGIRLINVARGPLVDERALIKALDKGQVAATALDVFEEEPLPASSRLRGRDNTIFGSHNGSNTLDAVLRTNQVALGKMKELLEHA